MNDRAFPGAVATVVAAAPSSQVATSWPAIISGAFVAIAVSMILMIVGTGIGFASFSPWASVPSTAKSLSLNATIWLIVTQWASAALGGYIAGRLRTRWIGTHAHEVFFRDTAHGLITWSVATVFAAAVLTATLWTTVTAGVHATTGVASAATMPAEENYDTDVLFRPALGSGTAPVGESLPFSQIEHIVANAAMVGHFPDSDRAYLANLVAARTGMPLVDAQKRVEDFITNTQAAKVKAAAEADVARKDAAEAALYVALSLVIGAFIACITAALGGRVREMHP